MQHSQSAGYPASELQSVVQHNCHISDAHHASNYTLCVYLLKMREYYRWEQQLGLGKALDKHEIGKWLSQREAYWDTIEDKEYASIELGNTRFDPFSSDEINEHLIPEGYVYSAGYGVHSKPLFFLAELDRHIMEGETNIYISSHEFARDLAAPPAMSIDNKMFIRKESLQRMLWEKIEEWRWSKLDNPMGRTIALYDFDSNFEDSLERMTDNEINTLILHESGEIQAGQLIDDGWHEMINECKHPQLELIARAVRDHLADALTTLPALIDRVSPSLHFYMAGLTGMRKHLVPSLMNAYNDWVKTGNIDTLKESVMCSKSHWLKQANNLIHDDRQKSGAITADELDSLIEGAVL